MRVARARRRVLGLPCALFLVSALFLAGCPKGRDGGTGAPPVGPPAPPVGAQCVEEQAPPPVDVPWKDVRELCRTADRGEPWPGAMPPLGPDWVEDADEYAHRVQTFLRKLEYREAPYSWLHDANWRMTGPYEGCPCPETDGKDCSGVNKGPHPAVRIYYSPEIIDWMCKYREGDSELPDAADIPDGAVIIKEMLNPDATKLAREPGTDELWIAPIPGKPDGWYDQRFDSWTIMIKASKASADGWYWAYFDKTGAGNPPLSDRAGFGQTPYPGSDGEPVTEPPACEWYPTFWQYSTNDVQYPNYQFGNYCVYCHASAQGQSTFASFTNILGDEIRYEWTPPAGKTMTVDLDDHARQSQAQAAAAAAGDGDQCPPNPFPVARDVNDPLPGFRATFPELDPTYEEVWATRLPARTWDHAVSQVGVPGVSNESSEFVTSDQCEGCHEAGGSGQLAQPNMVETVGDTQIDLAPWAEWNASPMGLAGRDPIFHAQLELERNIARDQPGLAKILDCIDNTCLHCHGAAGARQYNIDTAGQGPADDPCAALLPGKAERKATNYDGKPFTQRMVYAWRDEEPELAKYGGLARDGVNCTICHRISDVDLDQQNLARTFTGNFRVGPPEKIFGPFPNQESTEAIRPKPMENALGMTPEFGEQVASSELCGTCHTIVLPVFDDQGQVAGTAYEQATYLEWLLSEFNTHGSGEQGGKSCQDCHMSHDYGGKELETGIANIQGTRYPEADFLLAAADVDVPDRPYRRHKLYGLNVFLNAFAQQFPLLMGYRQQDYMNGRVRAPLLTALESVLEVAREETAELRLEELRWSGEELHAKVTVENLGGHNLPSGVGFRRLFIELTVLDAQDEVLWASGRTNDVGVILQGTTDEPLPTEFWQAGVDGLPFQPHHQVITDPGQVQIYEEATQNSSLAFTSSFLHRYWEIKDNRLRPKGWNPARVADAKRREEYAAATEAGEGPRRHWWPKPTRKVRYKNRQYPAIERYTDTKGDPDYDIGAHRAGGLPGTDSTVYRIRLSPELRGAVKKVRVTLYSQSAPPHYLKERFAHASQEGAERRAATQLYYISGHLNTDAKAEDGSAYLAGYKLRVGRSVEQAAPSP